LLARVFSRTHCKALVHVSEGNAVTHDFDASAGTSVRGVCGYGAAGVFADESDREHLESLYIMGSSLLIGEL